MLCPCNKKVKIKNVFGIILFIHEDGSQCDFMCGEFDIWELAKKMKKRATDNTLLKYMYLWYGIDSEIINEFINIKDVNLLKKVFMKYERFMKDMTQKMVDKFGSTFIENCNFLGIEFGRHEIGWVSDYEIKVKGFMLNIKEEMCKIEFEKARKNISKKYIKGKKKRIKWK